MCFLFRTYELELGLWEGGVVRVGVRGVFESWTRGGGVADQRDWLVLIVFLITSLVAAQLLHRAQNEAAIASALRRAPPALIAAARL